MAKILRINIKNQTFAYEEAGKYAGLGGRALTSRFLDEEVSANCHPLSAENKLIFATGLLAGTSFANSGRLSVGGKSPLTGTTKESNTGGTFCQKMSRMDLLAIILEDKPAEGADFVTVVINDTGVTFEKALCVGKGCYDTAVALEEKYGKKASTMMIGPAGEECLLSASIQFVDPYGNPARAAGRGGLGAVLGSKKIKSMVLNGEGNVRPTYADDAKFKAASKRWVEILRNHPVTGQGMPALGTAVLVNIINEAGAFPTKNFRDGRCDHVPNISGEMMAEIITKRGGKTTEGCHAGCVIQCSQRYVDEKGEYVTSGFEYETIWAFGGNSLIDNLDDIALLDRMCDDLGIDTIDAGNSVALAMDAGVIPWGDGKAAQALLARIYDKKDYLGKIMGCGTGHVGKTFGVDRVPVVKNQSLPAYDPRAVKGVGVTYATTTQGADHTAGYAVAQNILKVGGDVSPLGTAGQVETSKALQIATATLDSLGLCLFVAFAVLDTEDGIQCICDAVSARYGINFTADDFLALGTQALKNEITFNNNAGFSPQDDQLPEFFSKELLPPHNVKWEFTVEELQKAKVM